VWLYLKIAHALQGEARRLIYASPVTGEIVIFDHTKMDSRLKTAGMIGLVGCHALTIKRLKLCRIEESETYGLRGKGGKS
jgi:hypothetical protein